MLASRATKVSGRPTDRDLRRAFTLAPTTKPGSSIDLLVLEIRSDWPANTTRHRDNLHVHRLSLGDVVSHHASSKEHLDYYRNEAAKVGVSFSDHTFETEWNSWDLEERVEATLLAADALGARIGSSDRETARPDGVPWAHFVELLLNPSGPPPHDSLAHWLCARALDIDDAASSVRGTEAFFIAAAVEWIDASTGVDPFASKAIAPRLRCAVESAKEHSWDVPSRISSETRAILDLLTAAHHAAFDDEITPLSVGIVVRILAEARGGVSEPNVAIRAARALAHEGIRTGSLGAVLIAVAIGPERVRQLVSDRGVR